ncbi:uncharacterized protein LOC122276149 isoform X3 [Carya illinoinensis]|nr:uncharacterized protein LOC122276149 isoform X3 [Carya illinoinensis]
MFLNYWHEERFHLGRSTHQKYYGEASKPRCDSFGSRHAVQDARQGLVTWYGLHYLVCSCIARFCLMGGGRNAVAFISQILSTIASSKVNYCSSLQLRWKNGCFYAIILLLLLRSMHRGSFLLWLQVTRSMTSIHQIAQRHLQLLQHSFAKDDGRTSLQPTYGGMQVWLVCNKEWILLLQCGL